MRLGVWELAPLRRVQLAPKTRGRMPTKPRGRMDLSAVPWRTARYCSLTLKRALSGDDIRPAVCQPCVYGTRPRVFVASRTRRTSLGTGEWRVRLVV